MKRKKKTELEMEMSRVLSKLSSLDPSTDEYKAAAGNLSRLSEAYAESNRANRSISPDTILAVAANLLGIGLILGFEQAHVISTKALGLISKLRI